MISFLRLTSKNLALKCVVQLMIFFLDKRVKDSKLYQTSVVKLASGSDSTDYGNPLEANSERFDLASVLEVTYVSSTLSKKTCTILHVSS